MNLQILKQSWGKVENVREMEKRRERREIHIQRNWEKGERYTHTGERREIYTHRGGERKEREGFPVLSFYHLSVYLSIIYPSVCLSSIQPPITLGPLVIIHLPTNHLFVSPLLLILYWKPVCSINLLRNGYLLCKIILWKWFLNVL